MLFIDASELRRNSRLRVHLDELADVYTNGDQEAFIQRASVSDLEALTGADLILTPLSMPVTETLLPKHIEKGALLVQLKFGADLLSSMGDRMRECIARMRETGAQQHQCVLMFVGQLDSKKGMARVDGYIVKPKRKYEAVNRALWRWKMRGGVTHEIHNEYKFVTCLMQMAADIGMGGTTIEVWPTAPDPADFADSLLQEVKPVKDWRITLATYPGVGPVRANALAKAMKEAGMAPELCSAEQWATAPRGYRKKIPGWGDVTFDKCRAWYFGRQNTSLIDSDTALVVTLSGLDELRSKEDAE